jgi:pentafunctional AROM polypeptide
VSHHNLTTILQSKYKCNFIIVGAIPAEAQFKLPIQEMFKNVTEHSMGVCVDMAYKPRETTLLSHAKSLGWSTVEGVAVLLEQGFEQFAIWTGRKAPVGHIEEKIMEAYMLVE